MKFIRLVTIALAGIVFAVHVQAAEAGKKEGQVELPLEHYNSLVEASRYPLEIPRKAPTGYAIGGSEIEVTVQENENHSAWASIVARFSLEVLEDDWVSVPLLPVDTALQSALMDGAPLALSASPQGLSFNSKGKGTHKFELSYRTDARQFENGFTLPIALIQSSAAKLQVTLPGTGIDASIIPGSGLQRSESEGKTILRAAVPTSTMAQVSWRTGQPRKVSISRANYRGEERAQSIVWNAELSVELFSDQTETITLMPSTLTLTDLRIDGKPGVLFVEAGYFATTLKGKGEHAVKIGFQSPVAKEKGPSSIEFSIPEVPISKFELSLPGRKEVKVEPTSSVEIQVKDDRTKALAFVPMSSQVSFSWTESAPIEGSVPLSASAVLYQAFAAEEGVLSQRTFAQYEITRGETNLFEFDIPSGIQVNRISCNEAKITDWQIVNGKAGEGSTLKVFLERKLSGNVSLTIESDRGLSGVGSDPFPLPLIKARDLKRERGMIVLLSNKELMLQPDQEQHLLRVGENQIPAEIRSLWKDPVSHTFKYVEDAVSLSVRAQPPERKAGRFDAVINTLVSLGEVSLSGSSTIEINVKSGSIEDLKLRLPPKVNFLGLTSPSLRTHTVTGGDEGQVVNVQFTQEMDGQFTLEVKYEQILSEAQADMGVPTPKVESAEIEQGRIAIEALSAVEVQPATATGLSSIDASELPQQVLLKTTNPILLAYKYVQAEPPYKLGLKVTRHKQVDIQAATIDQAIYRTLFTADGIAVTSARFQIRNAREQFLRLTLPAGSEVWSLFVDGKAEKPALLESEKEKLAESRVLIKIINSAQGFPVDLVYRTKISSFGYLGTQRALLAQPAIVVTHTRWEAYLPSQYSYGRVDTNMQLVESGSASGADLRAVSSEMKSAAAPGIALQLQIPISGQRLVFEKLYANQGDEAAYFAVAYSVLLGKLLGLSLVGLAALALCFGMFLVGSGKTREGAVLSLLAIAALVTFIGIYGVSAWPVIPAGLTAAAGFYLRRQKSLEVLDM